MSNQIKTAPILSDKDCKTLLSELENVKTTAIKYKEKTKAGNYIKAVKSFMAGGKGTFNLVKLCEFLNEHEGTQFSVSVTVNTD